MKEILSNVTSYNLWANTRIIALLKAHSDLVDKEVRSSFPSLRRTTYHIWGAEEIWWKRLHGESLPKVPAMDFAGSFDEAVSNLLSASRNFDALVNGKDEEYLRSLCSYKDIRGNSWTSLRWQMIMHCMNHSTYHRGQIITMARELGVTTVPATDMIVYFREEGMQAPVSA